MLFHYFILPFAYLRYYENMLHKIKFSLYLKKAGLASRNIVHLQEIILHCAGFCFCIHHCFCEGDEITIDPAYTSKIIVPVACLNIL